MALDHVRDYFSGFKYEPTDLAHAGTLLFFTRWVTHFCAPVFIFLSGTSAYLSSGKNGTKKDASLKLLTRGIWLLLLEVTVIRFGWAFDFDYSLVFLQVIWAIGWSMIVLSGLIFFPLPIILFSGLLLVFGHNLMDNFQPSGNVATVVWQFLHVQGPLFYGNHNTIMVIYPLIPWVGVMALGYCFGVVFTYEIKRRNSILFLIGFLAIVLFIILRTINQYGDPKPWYPQPIKWHTILSFLNCTKYPPSLLYLLMTLGPAIICLPLLERMKGWLMNIFTVYGRVPMFYYILHIYLIHGMACIAGYFLYRGQAVTVFSHPGYSISAVYLFWLLAVLVLYFPCRWYKGIKQKHKLWWLSYL